MLEETLKQLATCVADAENADQVKDAVLDFVDDLDKVGVLNLDDLTDLYLASAVRHNLFSVDEVSEISTPGHKSITFELTLDVDGACSQRMRSRVPVSTPNT